MNSKELTDELIQNINRIISAQSKAILNSFNHNWIQKSYKSIIPITLTKLANLLNLINRNIFFSTISNCQEFEQILINKRNEIESSIDNLLNVKYKFTNIKSSKLELEKILKELKDTAYEYEM